MCLRLVKRPVFVFLVIFTAFQYVSCSKLRISSSRDDNKSFQTSGHQYGPPFMKPSKPDPHFDVLDEQRGYKTYYPSRLREGQDGSYEGEPTKLQEVARSSSSSSPSTNKACCKRRNKNVISKSTLSSRAGTPSFSSSSSSYETDAHQYAFTQKSTENNTPPKFSGSQLISGDVGMSESFIAQQSTVGLQRDGWKILMGPSIAPEEENPVDYAYNQNNDYDNGINKRAFTSLTDGEAKTQRTISKVPQRGKQSSKFSSSSTKLKYSTMDDFSNLKRITGQINRRSGKGKRENLSNLKGRAIQQISIPKQTLQHKHAKVTRRNQSSSSSTVKNKSKMRRPSEKKTKLSSENSSKLSSSGQKTSKLHYSTPIKVDTYRRIHQNRPNPASPVMTLDTKKLTIEPIASASAEHSTIPMMNMNMLSSEHFSGEPISSKSAYMASRFDRLSLYPSNIVDEHIIAEDDDEVNDDHLQFGHFQTKTALNLGEVYTPVVKVASSLSYNPNHQKEQGGIVTAASTEDLAPHLHNPLENEVQPYSSMAHPVEVHDEHENGMIDDGTFLHPPPMPPSAPAPVPTPHHVEFIPGTSHGRILVKPVHVPFSPSRFPHVLHNSSKSRPVGSSNVIIGSSLPTNPSLPLSLTFPPFRTIPLPLPSYEPFYSNLADYRNNEFHYLSPAYPPFSVNPNPSKQDHSHILKDSLPGSTNVHTVPIPGPSHHVPLILPHGHLPALLHSQSSFPSILRPPIGPYHPPLAGKTTGVATDIESGRKAPPVTHALTHTHLAPPPGVDPDHPAIQHLIRNPQNLLRDGIYIEPSHSGSNIHETTKNYLQYNVHKNALIPLDRRLVYLSMIFSWMFWITAFYTYYRYAVNGYKANNHFVLNVPHDGQNPEVISARSMDANNPWDFTKVLEYIEIAQKTYDGFDWQDLNCQKRTLCELVQKQSDPWGETGRKMANSYVYRVMDALDGVPVPSVIQSYLKQYKEAITQGKNPANDCGQIYSKCKFSIKDVLNKAGSKKKA